MPDRPLRVALAGAGMIANAGHIPAWREQGSQIEIAGICSRSEARATSTAARHAIPHAYADYGRMVAELEPDIVSICTPNVSHGPLAIAALEAGAHVFCEKPVAASYADAVAMYDAAEAAGRLLYVTQTGRFSNATGAARDIAAAGSLGRMYYAETSALRRRGVPTWGRFHLRAESGGGPLYDLGVHALDALLWIMGNPGVVAASGATYTEVASRDEGLVESLADSGAPVGVYDPRPYDRSEFDVEDMAAAFLRLEGGATIVIRVSWAANAPEDMGGTMILGTEGGLRLSPLTLIGHLGSHQADTLVRVPPDPAVPFQGHHRAASQFLRAISGLEAPLVRRDEVLNCMAALDGIYRSASEGREVSIP